MIARPARWCGARWLLLVGLITACGSTPAPAPAYTPDNGEPRTAWELEVLAALSRLPTGQVTDVSGRKVLPLPAYAAASGRRCMRVAITDPSGTRERLACEHDERWHFAADVFGAGPRRQGAP